MANIEFAGFAYDDAGDGINAATVNLYDRNDTATVRATTTTNSVGYWTISHATEGRFDIEVVSGSAKGRSKYDAAVQVLEIETANLLVRNPANTFKYDIVPTAITADRQLNLPLITGTDTLASLGLAATFSAIMTHSADIIIQDASDLALGTGSDALIRWSTGDSDNHSLLIALGDSNQGLHITDKAAVATDWNISATTHPNVYIHSNTTPATDYLRLGDHDGTTAYIDVVGGTTLAVEIAGTTEVSVDAGGVNLASGNAYEINGTSVLNATTLGSAVVASSLTSVGTLTALTMGGDINLDGNNIDNGGVIFLKEQADADSDVAGSGQIWVDTATPNVLMFTDDAGTDFTVAHNATTTLSSLVTVGALNSGSIATGFGAIDNGESNITTGGILKLDVDGSGVNAAGSLTFGTGNDAGIWYNGTNLYINAMAVGTGDIVATVNGTLHLLHDADASVAVKTENDDTEVILYSSSGGYGVVGTQSNSILRFITNNTTRLHLDNSGSPFTFQQATTITTSAGDLTLSSAADVEIGVNNLNHIVSASGATIVTETKNTSDTSSSAARVLSVVAGASAGDPFFTAAIAGVVSWNFGAVNASSDMFAIGNGTLGGSTDAIRISTAAPPVVSFNASQGSDFDYVCDECGKHEAYLFTCCGKVEWHDDVVDFRAMSQRSPDALDYMERVGVIQQSVDNDGVSSVFATTSMMYFVGSMAYQNRQRMDAHYQEQNEKLGSLEHKIERLEAQIGGGLGNA